MRPIRLFQTLTALAAAQALPAFAGAGLVTTTVLPLQTNVSYSVAASGSTPALQTYIGYTITVANAASNTNTINNMRFTGTAAATDGAEAVIYAGAEGLACTPIDAGQSVDCAIGQLRAGQSVSFAVFFRAPQKVDNGIADGVGEDKVSFSGVTYYAEGLGGLDNSVPQNSTSPFTAPWVTLGTNSPTLVKSALQKAGGQLYTGNGAVATAADTWTTTVSVPATAAYTTAEIAESSVPLPLAPNLLDQSSTDLTIPGSFAKLVILLRRDASTIVKGAKIASAKLYYSNPTTPDLRITYPYEVLACTDTTYGPLPQPGIPCIARRTEYTKKTAPTPEWEGDWEFEAWALDNGRYTN